MNKWISVVGLCLVAQTVANTIKRNGESSDIGVKSTEKVACLTNAKCSKPCPLGYQKDERGCLLCEKCKRNGIFESDILVTDGHYFHPWMTVTVKSTKWSDGLVDETYDSTFRRFGLIPDHLSKENRANFASSEHEWPIVNGEARVPYIFHSSISNGSQNYNMIMRGIEEYHNKTCIRFVPRTTEVNYIEFEDNSKCSATVGMVGGKQKVFLSSACNNKIGNTLHEIMHALGFLHEHNRPDRDDYVRIIWENMKPGHSLSFGYVMLREQWNSYGSPYDFSSVMQYGGNYFSNKKGPTIVVKATNQSVVAQRDGFSTQDLFQLNTKYSCTAYLEKPTTTASGEVCQDIASGCTIAKCNINPSALPVCRRTCGNCEIPTTTASGEVCQDIASGCTIAKCNINPSALPVCKKTCGNCGV